MIPAFFRRPGPAFAAGVFLGWIIWGDGAAVIQGIVARYSSHSSAGSYNPRGDNYQEGGYRGRGF